MSSHDQDNRDAPTYLAHYGMHRPPFTIKTEDDMYYAEPIRSKRLDILLHLTQYGNELLLVTGPEGSGKTTLMHQYLNKAHSIWKVCSINAHTKMDAEQLLYRICHNFSLPIETGDVTALVGNVKRQLDQLLSTNLTVVIVIDNAHVLATEVLSLLTELAKNKNATSGKNLRLILFAEPQIKIQFASAEMENKSKYPIRKIDLPPFDEQQTGELIRFRTKVAGLQADNTFTDAAISKIHKQSEGNPGDIVELAHRVLFEMTPLKRRTKTKPSAKQSLPQNGKKLLLIIAGIIAAAVIAAILIFQEEINQLFSNKPEKPLERTISALPIPPLSTEHPNQEGDVFPIENTLSKRENELPAPHVDQEKIVDTNIVMDEATTPEQNHPEVPANTTNDKSPSEQTPQSHAKHGSEIPTSNNTTDSERTGPIEEFKINVNREPWLLEQNPNHYTLQLLAAHKQTTVNNFLITHKLRATELAYYYSINNEQDWHSLVYGVYPDYRSAMDAVDALSLSLKKLKPWIRQFSSVQYEINKFRQ